METFCFHLQSFDALTKTAQTDTRIHTSACNRKRNDRCDANISFWRVISAKQINTWLELRHNTDLIDVLVCQSWSTHDAVRQAPLIFHWRRLSKLFGDKSASWTNHWMLCYSWRIMGYEKAVHSDWWDKHNWDSNRRIDFCHFRFPNPILQYTWIGTRNCR